MASNKLPDYARGYDGFPGRIGRTLAESQRAWPRPHRAPEGAPNVIVVLLDDMGFSDVGPYGSEIATPALDALAARGYSFTNYHTTPVCSPARAALMTGLNPHRAGFAHVANQDAGFPGLRLEIAEDVLTLPEALRANGYATYAVGKWHLTRDALMNDGADKSTWPCQRGFDNYYGSMEGCNSFFHPNRIVQDNTSIDTGALDDDGYYLTDDLTDHAIRLIKGLRASDPIKPFFLYFAHVAMHGPLGAKPSDLAKYRGAYQKGWDQIRKERLAKQIDRGLFDPGLSLPGPETLPGLGVPSWDSLSDEERARYERFQEVYAAMVDSVDQSLARMVELLTDMGELDNTLIIFTSDNGGTTEGGVEGTRSYWSRFIFGAGLKPSDLPEDWTPDVDRDLDVIGGPRSMVHYPRGWGMASNTPFRLYKGSTYAGGVRVPMIVSWPKGLSRPEGDNGVRRQFQYVTDILPTVLDLIGVEHPGERHGRPTQDIDGASFSPVLKRPDAPSTHTEQYAEFGGNRGFYRDGWKVVTNHLPGTDYDDSEWELYHVESDPNELTNLAKDEPEKLAEMAEGWDRAAWHNAVFPLIGRAVIPIRRPDERLMERDVRFLPGTPKVERYRSSKLTGLKSFTVAAEIDYAAGDQGVLFAHGDQGGGYAVFIEDGALSLSYNEYGRMTRASADMPVGARTVRAEFTAVEGLRWEITVEVDGRVLLRPPSVFVLASMAPFSGIEVGANSGGPIDWELRGRRGDFAYTGALTAITYQPGDPAPYSPALALEAERDAALFYD